MACKYCTTGTSMTIAFEEFEVCFKCIERALDRCFMAQNYLECPGCSSKSWDIINGQCINCGLTSEQLARQMLGGGDDIPTTEEAMQELEEAIENSYDAYDPPWDWADFPGQVEKKCECGGDKAGGTHASYCPKYKG